MTSNGAPKKSRPGPAPKPPAPRNRPITPMEAWYLQCLELLAAYLKRPPSITELANYCDRSITPCYTALVSLQTKGYVIKNRDKRFESRGVK